MTVTTTLPRLKERGISDETAIALGVRPLEGTGINPQDQWVELPYFKNGEHVNSKTRMLNGGKEMKFTRRKDDGGQICLYNHDCLLQDELLNEPLLITEGEIDVLSAYEAGFRRVVSVPNGAPAKRSDKPSETRYAYIIEVLPLLGDCREIILCTDGDEPGRNLAHDLSQILGRTRCKIASYPKECKDLNEALEKYGINGVRETIKRAKWCEVDAVYKMSELEEAPNFNYLELGWALDENLKVAKGQLSVWTGVPSHGKTTLINELCCRIAQKHKWKIAFASFEQHPRRMHRRNIISWVNSKPFQQQQKGAIEIGDQFIDDHFVFIFPEFTDEVSLEWMLEKMSACVVRHGCDMIVIDPWNEMDHYKGRDESLTEYTGRAIKTLKMFADRRNIHVAVVAHPAKMRRDGNGNYPVPELYDISDSAHWNNKPDLGVVVYRNFDEGLTEVHAKKIRDEPYMGKPGRKELIFDNQRHRFIDT